MCKQDRQRVSETIANYTLFDDAFMSEVFNENNELTQYVLRIILQKDDLDVTSVISQREIGSLAGRGVRLDIEAIDSAGNYYDVEVQRARKPGLPQRARFYQSMMDYEHVEKGEDFQFMRRSYIIFILDYDLYGEQRPIYHVEHIIRENGKPYDDGREILFVNGTYRNRDEDIGRLMHDFSCSDYHQMDSELIRETVRPYKEPNSKEGDKMSELVERIFREDFDKLRTEHDRELAESNQKLKESNQKLAESNLKMSEFEKRIARLEEQIISQKDEEISSLKKSLAAQGEKQS